jgi:hypothetical protein
MRMVIAIAFVLLVMAAGLAVAAENPEDAAVMNTIHQFVDGFNKADSQMLLGTCSQQTSVIDDFPPHAWQACSAWLEDYHTYARKNGITDGTIALGAPKHVDVTADRAYVVLPATFASMHHGKPMKEPGSTMTVVLQKSTTGWRITAWTWTEG